MNFIGHAQTWWGNIDKNHDQKVMYPKGRVTPGGLTDRLLSEHPNMFGDHSAGSGNNALIRDEEHTRGFLERHQDKLMFGSDCNDLIGRGPGCSGLEDDRGDSTAGGVEGDRAENPVREREADAGALRGDFSAPTKKGLLCLSSRRDVMRLARRFNAAFASRTGGRT